MTQAQLTDSTIATAATTSAALTFITCGSVDDGKSTLIGRLLWDSKALLQDQVKSAKRLRGSDAIDLAALTDGLSAEREQGITIDVAWRYFSIPERKFIIGDSPGHEQYTRNMITAASQAHAAVVLVDALKLNTSATALDLLPQTRRHTLLAQLLRVPTIIFAVNKLDAVVEAVAAFERIRDAIHVFAGDIGLPTPAVIPISALEGYNVVNAHKGWAGYEGPSLLQLLQATPIIQGDVHTDAHFSVQWIEKRHDSADTLRGRRVLWGQLVAGQLAVGDEVKINGGLSAQIATIESLSGDKLCADPGRALGIILSQELDVSRGDWLLAATAKPGVKTATATVAWLDDEPLLPGRIYWALHGHRWVKVKVNRIAHQLDVQSLEKSQVSQLNANAIGQVELAFQSPLPLQPFSVSRALGRMILVDAASHATAAAVLIDSVG